jgi:O-acetyl-ADP-ribose deacetylase (regulator of RNase III)
MSDLCPAYLSSGDCLIKIISNPRLTSFLTKNQLETVVEKWNIDCQGNKTLCTFTCNSVSEDIQTETVQAEETAHQEQEIPVIQSPKISIHKLDNPYLVKTDVLIYPTNISLTIDDPLFNRMSRNVIQEELDSFQKPINMGTVYITSNGGENSKVKAQKIYHATVAGESRLVNEVDLKSAIRKALLLADEDKARNVVIIPADCGTHDINDTARVQLAAIKTYLSTNKNSNIKNIFIVMEDEESYQVFEEYYNRIFL